MCTLSIPSRFCRNATVFSRVSGPLSVAGCTSVTAMMQQERVVLHAERRMPTVKESISGFGIEAVSLACKTGRTGCCTCLLTRHVLQVGCLWDRSVHPSCIGDPAPCECCVQHAQMTVHTELHRHSMELKSRPSGTCQHASRCRVQTANLWPALALCIITVVPHRRSTSLY